MSYIKLSYEIPFGRNRERIERRTSNAQHRTLNIDDALRGVGATTPTSPLPARRLHGLTGRRGSFALLF